MSAALPDPSAPAPSAPDDEERRMPFLDHLAELRKRLRNAVLAFLLATGVCAYFAPQLWDFMTRPVRAAWFAVFNNSQAVFHYSGYSEAFWVYTKIALVFALFASSPIIFWEIWRFIAPGLYSKERRIVVGIVVATAACFVGGALFGYKLLCFPAVKYLLSLATVRDGVLPFRIEPTIMMNEALGFLLMMLVGCGIAFETPVVLGLLGWMGFVSSRALWRFNRYAIIVSFLLGGVLTPGPDVLSQVMMSTPLFGLYNLSIIVVWLLERARRKKLDDIEKSYDPPSSSPPAPLAG